jgi:hypothetical protein
MHLFENLLSQFQAGHTRVLGVHSAIEQGPAMLFEEVEIQIEQSIATLARQLRENINGGTFLQQARDLSWLLYLVLSSYILLSPSERIKVCLLNHCRLAIMC